MRENVLVWGILLGNKEEHEKSVILYLIKKVAVPRSQTSEGGIVGPVTWVWISVLSWCRRWSRDINHPPASH